MVLRQPKRVSKGTVWSKGSIIDLMQLNLLYFLKKAYREEQDSRKKKEIKKLINRLRNHILSGGRHHE